MGILKYLTSNKQFSDHENSKLELLEKLFEIQKYMYLKRSLILTLSRFIENNKITPEM